MPEITSVILPNGAFHFKRGRVLDSEPFVKRLSSRYWETGRLHTPLEVRLQFPLFTSRGLCGCMLLDGI